MRRGYGEAAPFFEVAIDNTQEIAVQLRAQRTALAEPEARETGREDFTRLVCQGHLGMLLERRSAPCIKCVKLTVGRPTPRSASDSGRIRRLTMQPAPECVSDLAGELEPVSKKRCGVRSASTARLMPSQITGNRCHSSRRIGPVRSKAWAGPLQ